MTEEPLRGNMHQRRNTHFTSQYMGNQLKRFSVMEKKEKTTQYVSHCVSSTLVPDSTALIDLYKVEQKKKFLLSSVSHVPSGLMGCGLAA